MSALRVGLTGGLASGKSTVAALLAARGCRVIDADRLVAELYRPGGEGAAAVRELFGEGALTPEGAVDHPAVARRVFADPEARRRIERAIHPLVRRRFAEIAAAEQGIVVLEATLLVEAGYGPDFDLVVTVEADPERRVRRAVARGMAEAEARARLAAQGDGAARRTGAHRVIWNDADLAALTARVDALMDELREMARRCEEEPS
jgi:dephospho-CoA kinase